MNKKILLMFTLIMTTVMLATLLIGTSMGKEKVYAELLNAGADPLIPGEIWITNGGIQQQKGNSRTFYHVLTIGEDSYPLVSVNNISATYNTGTGYFVGQYDAIWYIPSEGADSGFKGIAIGKIYDFDMTGGFPPFSRITVHCTMQGFGDFEGQTLKFSVDGDLVAYQTWTGYCIKK